MGAGDLSLLVQYISLDKGVLTPSPCEEHMDTGINSHAGETVVESYAKIYDYHLVPLPLKLCLFPCERVMAGFHLYCI